MMIKVYCERANMSNFRRILFSMTGSMYISDSPLTAAGFVSAFSDAFVSSRLVILLGGGRTVVLENGVQTQVGPEQRWPN
jgi:hypothetical protein